MSRGPTKETAAKIRAARLANNPNSYTEAGKKAAATLVQRFGKDYYLGLSEQGTKAYKGTGGFASKRVGKDGRTGPERARLHGGSRAKRRINDDQSRA